jgi:hypothetical protein
MARKSFVSVTVAAFVAIPCLSAVSTDAIAAGGGAVSGYHGYHGGMYAGGIYRGAAYPGAAYRGAVYRGGVYRADPYRGAFWRARLGRAIGIAAAAGAAGAAAYTYRAPCGYYPYPPCY